MATKRVEDLLKEKKIYQIINPRIVLATPDLPVEDAIKKMQEHRSGYLVIAQGKKCVGIFTETDVVRKVLEQDVDWKRPVKDFMTSEPVVLNPDDTVGAAIDVMGTRRFYHIPLVDEKGELVNVISVRTLIRFLAEFYPAEILNLPPRPNQVMERAEGG
jgi:CBS domain-containing protein